MKLLSLALLISLSSCAYHFGHGNRSLPGGHKTVYVEIFENKSKEVGAEASFTQALNKELVRSGFSVVTSPNMAELVLKGSILRVTNYDGGQIQNFYAEDHANKTAPVKLPATYFTSYAMSVMTNLKAVRSRDQKVIWQANLAGYKNYLGASLTKQGIRSSNVLYNQSRRKQTMKLIAQELMQEAFDRLTEKF